MAHNPSSSYFIFFHNCTEHFPSESDGWPTENTSYRQLPEDPFPPNPPASPSLSTSILHSEKGKRPTSPNNYETFTEESDLQFLLNVKLPPLQEEDNPIYKS